MQTLDNLTYRFILFYITLLIPDFRVEICIENRRSNIVQKLGKKGVKLDLRATTWLTDFWTVFFYEEPLASTTPLVCVVQSNLSSS